MKVMKVHQNNTKMNFWKIIACKKFKTLIIVAVIKKIIKVYSLSSIKMSS